MDPISYSAAQRAKRQARLELLQVAIRQAEINGTMLDVLSDLGAPTAKLSRALNAQEGLLASLRAWLQETEGGDEI